MSKEAPSEKGEGVKSAGGAEAVKKNRPFDFMKDFAEVKKLK